MDTDTQRCTGHKQDHQFSQGQYECILTPRAAPSAALATNRTISSHREQYECILTPSAALAANRTISSHRGQYECILTPSAALATNRTISSHRGQYECILTPRAALDKRGLSLGTFDGCMSDGSGKGGISTCPGL